MKKLGARFWDIVERIKDEYTPERIILYGSFAYGHPNRNSDIDLLIIKDTQERPIDRRIRVRRIADIRDSSYPAFSPIVLTNKELKRRVQIGDQFVKEILNKGKVLYAK
ncbi:MAG: nucleotidyltransferase domain-containing protein [Planctomycetota bacterium]